MLLSCEQIEFPSHPPFFTWQLSKTDARGDKVQSFMESETLLRVLTSACHARSRSGVRITRLTGANYSVCARLVRANGIGVASTIGDVTSVWKQWRELSIFDFSLDVKAKQITCAYGIRTFASEYETSLAGTFHGIVWWFMWAIGVLVATAIADLASICEGAKRKTVLCCEQMLG